MSFQICIGAFISSKTTDWPLAIRYSENLEACSCSLIDSRLKNEEKPLSSRSANQREMAKYYALEFRSIVRCCINDSTSSAGIGSAIALPEGPVAILKDLFVDKVMIIRFPEPLKQVTEELSSLV